MHWIYRHLTKIHKRTLSFGLAAFEYKRKNSHLSTISKLTSNCYVPICTDSFQYFSFSHYDRKNNSAFSEAKATFVTTNV